MTLKAYDFALTWKGCKILRSAWHVQRGCLPVCSGILKTFIQNFTKFPVNVTYGRGSVLIITLAHFCETGSRVEM